MKSISVVITKSLNGNAIANVMGFNKTVIKWHCLSMRVAGSIPQWTFTEPQNCS